MPDEFDTIRQVLKFKTIAVVGLSKDPQKDSHRVAFYLTHAGYRIIPVNPTGTEVLGQVCYQSLVKIPGEVASTIETVCVFRPSEEVLPILVEMIELYKSYGRVKALWLQEGISNDKAKAFCQKAGFLFVQNRCMMKEHQLV